MAIKKKIKRIRQAKNNIGVPTEDSKNTELHKTNILNDELMED